MSQDEFEILDITPEQFEKQVAQWLSNAGENLKDLKVNLLKKMDGAGGEYEIDAVAEFTAFGGAIFKVLIECKRYAPGNSIKRDQIMVLHSKCTIS